ncbi:MAG TPA: cytochrome P450 [Polyangium sp.]|nr:cytochrome P450 [Polyangium sp.]
MNAPTKGGCPHLGALYNPTTSPQVEDPHPIFERMRKEEPVTYSPLFNLWLVSRYDDVLRVVNDPKRFTIEGSFTKLTTMFQPEAQELLRKSHTFTALNMFCADTEHDRLRKPFAKFFSAAQIAAHEPMIRRVANELLDAFDAEEPVDYVTQFAFPFPLRVIFSLLGVPTEAMADVRRGVEAMMRAISALVPPEEQIEVVERILVYEQYWIDTIKQRSAKPGDDIISLVIRAIDAGEANLTLPEFVSTISANLILAGHETTARSLATSLYHLLSHRERYQALVDEPTLIPKAVEELMRFDSTTIGFFRTATEAVEVGGVAIPKGAAVFPLYSSANHDEARFADPTKVDFRRPEVNEQIAFGRGIHFCLGVHLARLEQRIALELLTTRWPQLRLASEEAVPFTASLTMRGPASLLITTREPQI